ncbi:G-type lectin S-receptor-like serine/threonine-protein kinase [Prunus yedoensis var. nudiflora]|uniref:G-type lectin S-receptor-like serine/threonine-protein kinase n=1 Tax=Prunus yedoensis var. nudiflora TaxID=2094558 RepID=A0A314Y542_PRUYE|nr:G-type lectin S-receptor-like serine/threonine-protein kinase [Prunus yedoensis var. nudiflora]
MLLGFDSKSGKRNVLTAWKSESDPSTGMFLAGLTPQVPSQVPAMDDGNLSGFYLDDNVKQGTKYFSYNFLDKTVAYIDITSEGILKLMYSASESPTSIRECLKGFVPKSDEEWSEGNRTGGCVWQTKLSCESNTNKSVTLRGKGDGFSKMVGLKVPDFHEYIMSSDAEECKIQCLNNYEGNRMKLIVSLTAIGKVKLSSKLFKLIDNTESSRDTLEEYIRNQDPSELFMYNFDSILIATDNFNITNKLGEGGFGPVYKGMLQEGKEIAVKRLVAQGKA